jgi:predicted nucleic acid-binding protein
LPTVSDASPLIWLSKIGRIALLRKLYGIVMVPEEVYREVVEEGLERGLSDALVVKDSVDEGWIRVSKLNEGEAELCRGMVEHASEIHLGEAQAIALAREEGALLLMDESSGRAFAETWGLRVRGTLYVLLRALREGILSKDDAREAILQLVQKEFRIDPRLLTRLLKEVECFTPRRG